jgi:hypothetical protein
VNGLIFVFNMLLAFPVVDDQGIALGVVSVRRWPATAVTQRSR